MVDNTDEQYDGEEGEYHFSDDQVNYELETDTPKTEKSAVPSSNMKEVLLTKLTQHRKILIGVVVFLILTGIVYKIVVPSSTIPNTNIIAENSAPTTTANNKNSPNQPSAATAESENLQTAPSQQPTQPSQSVQTTPTTQPSVQSGQSLAQSSLQSAQPQVSPGQQPFQGQQTNTNISSSSQSGASNMISPTAVAQASGPSINAPNTIGQNNSGISSPTVMAQAAGPSPMAGSQSGVASENLGGQATSNTIQSTPSGMVAPSGVAQSNISNGNPSINPLQQAQSLTGSGAQQAPTDVQSKNMVDRLASLEQQNAAIMNLLQTEYAQKMSDYETQNTSSRGKMEELTKRINRMESLLVQLSQIIQNGRQTTMTGPLPSNMVMGSSATETTKVAEPKINYSVQAIIPGRAWLKSESGDTITVAEGDILRSYGRVTKIDPYDGIVNIDTGNKVITLSYGVSAD